MQLISLFPFICPEGDSNSHAIKHTHLKRACLPISASGRICQNHFFSPLTPSIGAEVGIAEAGDAEFTVTGGTGAMLEISAGALVADAVLAELTAAAGSTGFCGLSAGTF